MTPVPVHNFSGQTALVLHLSPEIGQRIKDRCDRLGVRALILTDDLETEAARGANTLILDIDTGDDRLLPWPRAAAPMPLIGLIGSESPGRLAWALAQEVDAFIPVSGLGNLFSAMVIAHATFAQKAERRAREADEARRGSGRLDVVRAVLALMEGGRDEALALKQLRTMAMVERISIEEAASRLLSERHRAGGRTG
ncbi:transcriptional antiterminator [Roseovarius sp. D22-M7]|uniref:transcriptional antiterminator n=1 Tax=Roseovarius sp. D22-M7 TaxID=3127116 RepID=UPI0030105CC1